jgi:hypothetical protein
MCTDVIHRAGAYPIADVASLGPSRGQAVWHDSVMPTAVPRLTAHP